jgi:penicillin-binding protein 1A
MPTDDDLIEPRVSLWGRWRSRRFRRRSVFWRWRRLLFLGLLIAVAGLAGVGLILSNVDLPQETDTLAQTSFICTHEVSHNCGPDTAAAQLSGEENRVVVPYDQIPQVLINAVVAAEDQNFWEHGGVDPVGIARAAWEQLPFVNESASTQGGSTITQQYVKIAILEDTERTIARKVREAIYALELERELSKRQILQRYLNIVYFGRGAYGVQAAAQAYFYKDVGELNLADAAYLAGLIRAPESADADRDPAEATRRRHTVLVNMLGEGYISRDEYEQADEVEWAINPYGICPAPAGSGRAPSATECPPGSILPRTELRLFSHVRGHDIGSEYFYEAVRRQLVDLFGEERVYGGGLRVYTTLDQRWQRAAYESVTAALPQPGPEGSLVAIGADGRVRAMMGGRDYNVTQVNLAMGRAGGGSGRQPGSAFKPYALAEALAQGYSAEAHLDAPSCVDLDIHEPEPWHVCGGGASGGHTLLSATAASSNVAFAQLMLELGTDNVLEMAHRIGVTSDLPAVPSIVLGAGEVSVLDMASGFSTFRDHGLRTDPVLIERVEDSHGNVIYQADDAPEQVISPQIADTVTTALRGVVTGGTGTAAQLSGWDVAGKTGTTQNNKDAWFVGYTCRVSAAMWIGNVGAPGQPVESLGTSSMGGTVAAPVWRAFQQRISDEGLVENDCELAEVTDFPGRTSFDDLEVDVPPATQPLCPAGMSPADLDQDGVVESCVANDTGGNDGTTPTTQPPPTTRPPPPTTQPPPPTTVTVPGPGGGDGNGAAGRGRSP